VLVEAQSLAVRCSDIETEDGDEVDDEHG